VDVVELGPLEVDLPAKHPMAQTVDKKAAMDLVKAGTVLVDVRNAAAAKEAPIPGAINASVENDLAVQLVPVVTPELFQKIARVDDSRLPGPQDTKFIVFSHSERDFLSYNVITVLASRGYSSLFWLRAGASGWLERPLKPTPTKYNDLKIASAFDVADDVSKGTAILVDVRSTEYFERRRVPKSVHLKFRDPLDASGNSKTRAESFESHDLAQMKTWLDNADVAKLKKDARLILMGHDEYDWSAFKAALVLQNLGYRVEWMRKGIREWGQARAKNPQAFAFEQKSF
jgi:rhodanese-related sulfurtransferase